MRCGSRQLYAKVGKATEQRLIGLFTYRTRSRAGSAAHLIEGLHYVRSSPAIMALIAMNLVVVVFGQPYQTLMNESSGRVPKVWAGSWQPPASER
jgi:hypothetical protein